MMHCLPAFVAAVWCLGVNFENVCCSDSQTCGPVSGGTACKCSTAQFKTCLDTGGASNGCKATSSTSNP